LAVACPEEGIGGRRPRVEALGCKWHNRFAVSPI
jgi:hypothetical protein